MSISTVLRCVPVLLLPPRHCIKNINLVAMIKSLTVKLESKLVNTVQTGLEFVVTRTRILHAI